MKFIISIFFVLFTSSTIAQPIRPLSRNDISLESLVNAEAEVLDFLIRLFLPQLGGQRSRGGNTADLVRVGANFLRTLSGVENRPSISDDGDDIDVRSEVVQDPRVLSFGEEIGRRNQIQQNFQITPNQLAVLSRLFSGFLNILR